MSFVSHLIVCFNFRFTRKGSEYQTFNMSTRRIKYVIQLVHNMLVLAVKICPRRIFRRSEVKKNSWRKNC